MGIQVIKTNIPVEGVSELQLIATDDKKNIAGFAHIGTWEKSVPYVYSVFVQPKARRKGLATSLISEAISLCRKHKKTALNLWVHPKNHGAIKVYRKLGFVVVQEGDKLMMNHSLNQKPL